jgi:hypothetical protein
MVVQKDRIRIGIQINAKVRRGASGIFAMQEAIYGALLGLKLPGYDPLALISFGPLQGSGPNNYQYYIQFSTITNCVESQPEATAAAPVLTNPQIVDYDQLHQ